MLNKKEFLDLLANRLNKSRKEMAAFCDVMSEIVLETIKKEHKLKFLEIGTFSLGLRAARKGINPRTQKPVNIPAKKVLKFKASKNASEFFAD